MSAPGEPLPPRWRKLAGALAVLVVVASAVSFTWSALDPAPDWPGDYPDEPYPYLGTSPYETYEQDFDQYKQDRPLLQIFGIGGLLIPEIIPLLWLATRGRRGTKFALLVPVALVRPVLMYTALLLESPDPYDVSLSLLLAILSWALAPFYYAGVLFVAYCVDRFDLRPARSLAAAPED